MNRSRLLSGLAALAAFSLAGCLANMPPDDDPVHLRIGWVDDYETARGAAAECRLPILLVMVAGDKLDRC